KQWEIHDDHPQNLQQVHRSQDIIIYFDKEGLPVSWFQDPISGHIYFDVCNVCEECQVENILGLDLPDLPCKKKSKSKQDLHPYYQKCLNILEKEGEKSKWNLKPFCKPEPLVPIHTPQIQECFMFSEADFPKFETFNKNGSRHTPKIQNISSTILPSGETVRPNPAEDVLNWQTENSLVQNTALISIHKNISEAKDKIEQIDTTVSTQQSQVSHMIEVFEKRLQELKYIMPSDPSTLADFILNKEKETKFIQDQLHVLKTTGQVPTYDVGPSSPLSRVSSMYGAVPLRN
ncbi:unnamed protein product, partial [Coffea canephora]